MAKVSAGFVVLPDTADAAEVQALVPFGNPRMLAHASGRPWLVGEWPPERVLVAAAGPTRLAVIGHCPVGVREALRRTAGQAQPLADDLATHQVLLMVRSNTASYRLLGQLYAESGVELDMPYLDDGVLEATLRVAAHEHAGPWRFKPLLADAMRGIVPEEVLRRSTKGEFGKDIRRGLRRNLPAILQTFADSALADRGLIAPATLRARLTAPQPDNTTTQTLENLLGCETWLRTATATATRRAPGAAPSEV